MDRSDRPSRPELLLTPVEGFVRPGLVYVDDSDVARRTMRRALYTHGVVLETFASGDELRARDSTFLVAALLDFDLDTLETGADLARMLRERFPHAQIAFFTSSEDQFPPLAPLGPVFSKADGTSAPTEWLLAQWRDRGAGEMTG